MLYNLLLFSVLLILFIILLFTKSGFTTLALAYALIISLLIFTLAIALTLWVAPLVPANTVLGILLASGLEEAARAIIFFWLLHRSKHFFSQKYDKLKVAGIAGIIFALLESAGYLATASFTNFFVRQVVATPLHLFLSMIHVQWRLVGFFVAWIIHAIYNYAYDAGPPLMQISQIFAMSSWLFIVFWLKNAKPKLFRIF